MRKLLREFRAFALSGNVLDLALGFLIGAAFSTLVQSLARNVLLQFVAAIFGQTDFSRLHFSVNKARIYYGSFLTDLLNFILLAGVLFLVVKVMSGIGVLRNPGFAERECPYCLSEVVPHALVCKACGQALVSDLPVPEEARQRLKDLRTRRRIPVPVRRRTPEPPA
ncbi:MAG TPA: large conductance mechanosensitive channel protein MscL [Rugosimonospora sp.]|nr:large conductance mechanosensitive channel protein MscL [Rugosimonospora sp.]